jgi:hypothetical protein
MGANGPGSDWQISQIVIALVGLALFVWGIPERADPLLISGAILIGAAIIAKSISDLPPGRSPD